jgi:predicted Zn-dependent protease
MRRSADEGRSAFSKQGGGTKLGEKIVDERVTLLSDPRDPDLLSNTFDGQGLAGAPKRVHRERRAEEAARTRASGRRRTTSSPMQGTNAVKLVGGTQTRDDLIKSTTRGILVTRLWYLRQVDPRTVLIPDSRATARS